MMREVEAEVVILTKGISHFQEVEIIEITGLEVLGREHLIGDEMILITL